MESIKKIFFWNTSNPTDRLKEARRTISRSVRALERDRAGMQRDELRRMEELRNAAQKGRTAEARLLAKDIAMMRKNSERLLQARLNLQGLETKLRTAASSAIVSDAMRSAVRAMIRVNARMNLSAVRDILREFDKQTELLEMKQELMDEIGNDDDIEEEENELISRVLDEVGLVQTEALEATKNSQPDVLDRLEKLRAKEN